MLKPVSYYQFSTKLDRALQRICRRRGGQITLQVGGGVQLLATDDILYLETRDRLLHYHTTTGTWSVRGSLLKAEKDLTAYHFARCNQCYLVNLRHVRGVQDDFVQVGRNGWRSAAASAQRFWPPWRRMSGVRCRWIPS